MGTSTVLLPLTGWALVGAFGLIIVLALACVFFVRGVRMLRKAEELAPHMMALEALKADIAKAEGEMDNLRSKLENAKTTIAQADEARQYIEEHQPRVESMRREEELLQTNLTVAKDRLQKATEAYTDQEEKVNQLHKQATDLQQTLDFQEARLREVQAETTRLQSDRKQLEAAIAALSKKRQEVEMALASLAAKQAELERLDREIDRLRAEVAELSLQHSKLTQQNDNLKITQSKLNASIQELIAKESEARIACEKAEKELEELRRELEALQKKRDETQEQADTAREEANEQGAAAHAAKSEAERYTGLVDKRKEDLIKVNAALAEARGTLDALKRKISAQTTLGEGVKDAWQDLERPAVVPVDRLPERRTEDELKWLAGFNALLRTHGFHFPERTLRAFHTGLKCGEVTPIVVLAGISGTGKSLLPELYAAAAGMNFLSVPVQPRWDGPQDVLGFYNYMEGRYKATELARFLWQADRWNNRDGADAFSADALNIVLLDEMNLARVEYYFADFLSKLEQRRGKNLDAPEQRRAVELFLECGAGLGGRNLCVGTNTFFIGTMNEDETTQMLSDKVIDRSNLLRFGRPDDMQEARPDKGAFLEACAGRAKVTLPLWKAWSQPKAVHQQEYQKLLRDLNDALDNVGRPFAYRVQQSVDAYMAAYPDPNDWRKAFADQIEMKVLPKLNGLEIASSPEFNDTAKVIRRIVDELGDTDLQKEFERASDVDNTFFRWRGVMRKEASKK